MKKEIITTADGSKTIHFPEWNESYHSKHGAIQEARHVYINAGLDDWCVNNQKKQLNVLEIGFGTGLNAFLSCEYATKNTLNISYHSIEKFPLGNEVIKTLNYKDDIKFQADCFDKIHDSDWEKPVIINDYFKLKKLETDLASFKSNKSYDVIFFDAFGPRVQPELWTKEIFENLYNLMTKNAVWVTYSCKGSVRRDLISTGMVVEKIPGPPGKREMLRGLKLM